ncbi:MAG: hypothetical protein EDR02_11830 [Actinobacteria bacterium]|nr:MAG: hypothetical protein EDR02_11830 [Actinomycetota bacterium]
MKITLDCEEPGCEGTVSFESLQLHCGSKSGRMPGRCDSCATLYTLYGGKAERVRDLLPDEVAKAESVGA